MNHELDTKPDKSNPIYRESNLTREITVNDVANHVYASNAHYQRVFSLATGITIGDYIRNRRLSLAGQEKIYDICVKTLKKHDKTSYYTSERIGIIFSD